MEFVRISDNASVWCGINREDPSKNRPTHMVEFISEGERVSKPQNDGFYYAIAEEPYFAIRNANSSHSTITISLSQLNKSMKYYGVSLEIKDIESVPRFTNEEMFEKSKSTGMNHFLPRPGGGKICYGCPHQLARSECIWVDKITLDRYNDGIEYCYLK